MPNSIEIVAHRGTGKDYYPPVPLQAHRPAAPPENTLPAFQWGWARGHTCELDVYLTCDDHVVVIHDDTTGRTCDRDLDVAESTLEQLRGLDAGVKKGQHWKGLRLPTLQEVLAAMGSNDRLYVELKQGPGLVKPLLDVCDQSGKDLEQIVFISFSIDSCAELKRIRRELAVYWIIVFEETKPGIWRAGYDRTVPEDKRHLKFETVWQQPLQYEELLRLARQAKVDGLDVSFRQPHDFAAAMKEAKVPWGCWSVDDADVAVAMAKKGAFQITSNCTDDIRSVLHGPA